MPRITITISDGNVTDVTGLDDTYEVEVRDYDIPRDWDENEVEENTRQDAMGDRYQGYMLAVRPTTGG